MRFLACLLCLAAAGCRSGDAKPTDHLVLAGYTTIREVVGGKLIPGFKKSWQQAQHRDVVFEESYLGSGAQARAIASGFQADVALLSLAPDIEQLAEKGIVDKAWASEARGGMVSRSVVVLAVRKGNPQAVHGWADLERPGLKVLTPDPRTSGGARWNIAALWGGAPAEGKEPQALLERVLRNVTVMDKGARESMLTFEKGVGDVAITYETEAIAAAASGAPVEYVVPKATLLIENPGVVVAASAKKHGSLEAARAFVEYLKSPEGQAAFAANGFRPFEGDSQLPAVEQLFTIESMGGWPKVNELLFARGAGFERAAEKARE